MSTTAQTTATASEATAPVADTPQAKQPTTVVEKYKVKLDEAEEEVDLEELKRGYQKAKVSDKRFQEAAALRKQVDDLVAGLSKGDKTVLKQLWDVIPDETRRQVSEETLLDWIKVQQMPEGDRKAMAYEKELNKLKADHEKLTKDQEEKGKAEAVAQATHAIDQEISKTLEANQVKATPRIIARMAEYMLAHLNTKGTRLDAKTALDKTLNDLNEDVRQYHFSLPAEKFLEQLPKEYREALRKAELAKVMAQDPLKSRQAPKGEPSTSKKKSVSTDDYFKKLETRLGG